MNELSTMRLVLIKDEASEVRDILRKHLRNGIWFKERISWWLWIRFDVSGREHSMQALRSDLSRWGVQKDIENAW